MLTHNRTPMPSRLLLNDRTSLNHDWLSHNLRTENLPRWNSKSSREKYFLHTEGLRSLHLRFILGRTENPTGTCRDGNWNYLEALRLTTASEPGDGWGGNIWFFHPSNFWICNSLMFQKWKGGKEGGREKRSVQNLHLPDPPSNQVPRPPLKW